MTTTIEAGAKLPVLLHVDPEELLADRNQRSSKPSKDMVASVRRRGIIQVPTCVRTCEGRIRVRVGHKRVAAAIQVGLPEIPVLVVADEGTSDQAAIDEIIDQYEENEVREGFTAAEKAQTAVNLLALDLTVAQVADITRLKPEQVKAAKTVADSKAARRAAAAHQLTIEQALAFAEFDGDKEAQAALMKAAGGGPEPFAHVLQQQRDHRDEQEAVAAARAEAEKTGAKVAGHRPEWKLHLTALRTPDGKEITPAAHRNCPGHSAYVAPKHRYAGQGKPSAETIWFCDDPKGNGHRPSAGPGSPGTEVDPEQRKTVIEGNKRWRAATQVRHGWLREFLAGKTPPKDAVPFVLESVLGLDTAIHSSFNGSQATARQLLALPDPEYRDRAGYVRSKPLLEAYQAATGKRREMIALGMVLGAYEGFLTDHTWRQPSAEAQRYLSAIAAWGYPLSEIEQGAVDGLTEDTVPFRAGAPAAAAPAAVEEAEEAAAHALVMAALDAAADPAPAGQVHYLRPQDRGTGIPACGHTDPGMTESTPHRPDVTCPACIPHAAAGALHYLDPAGPEPLCEHGRAAEAAEATSEPADVTCPACIARMPEVACVRS